jgi:hypothetical protein
MFEFDEIDKIFRFTTAAIGKLGEEWVAKDLHARSFDVYMPLLFAGRCDIVIQRDGSIEARLTDMIEFMEQHLFVMSAAAVHIANSNKESLRGAARQAEELIIWRDTQARKGRHA